jgi:type IV pilus secretin PilQ/predicted competence protein
MGSLTRKKKSRILLTAVAAFLALSVVLSINLFSAPVLADDDIEQRKIRRLEALGLNGQDPAIVEAAYQATTLYSVDVLPNDENINVVLQLSDIPEYETYEYSGNRLVMDLSNTINLSPTSVFALEEDDPVRRVRNSQYRVTPSFVSRVVFDLGEGITPEIRSDDGTILITVSMPEMPEPIFAEQPVEVPEEMAGPAETGGKDAAAPVETVAVPPVEVETEVGAEEIIEIVEPAKDVAPMEVTEEAEEELEELPAEPVVVAEEEVVVEEIVEVPAEDVAPMEMAEEAGEEMEELPAEPVVVAEEEVVVEEVVEVPAEDVAPMEMAEEAGEEMEELPAEPVVVAEEEVVVEEVVEVPAEEPEPVVAPVEEPPAAEEPAIAMPEPTTPVAPPAVAPPTQMLFEPEPPPDQQLISLTFRDADLAAVLDLLARKGNLNILAGKDVKGEVTVRLVDVPLDVALNAILNVNGYGYIRSENIIRILPLKEIGEEVRTETRTYLLSYASADKAKSILEGFLTPNGNIQTDERTNTLIVTDVPANMERFTKLLPEIDRRVKQVLIEVLILDSVLGDEGDLGISWALVNNNDNSPVLGDDTFPDELGVLLPVGVDALNLTFRTIMGDLDLTAFIEAIVTESDSKVLASPKILTLNNEAASIEIVEEFPYRDVTETSAGGQLTNITFKDIGTKLEVKPQITHDDHVILFIAPEQNNIAGVTSIGVPIVDTRKAETTLIIKNHQTVVIGGLRENREVTGVTKVPLLGDLPGVKYIFRSVSTDKRDSELILFLTVHIVEQPVLLPEDKVKAGELANMPRMPNAAIEMIR